MQESKETRTELFEERLNAFMNGATDGFLIFDADLNLIEINPASLSIFPEGTVREDLLGKHITQVQPELDKTDRYEAFRNTLRTGEPFVAEDVVPGRPFGNKHLWVRAFKVGDGLGIISTDMSSQHEAREKTEHLNRALRLKNLVFEESIAALSNADTAGIITEVNTAFLKLRGYQTKEAAIGESVGSFFVNEEDAGPVLEALGSSGRWEGEFLARRADGSTFTSHGLATAMRNDRGELIGYQSANLDITDRKRSEQSLREAHYRLEEAQRVAQLGSWEWDAVKDEITGSAEFYRLFDVAPEELTRYSQFAERLHPDDRERVERDVADAVQLNRPYDTDYRVKRRDGTWRDISARGRAFPGAEGKAVSMMGTCLDITERKTAELELHRYEHIVSASTDMIALLDRQFTYLAANKEYLEAFDKTPGELIGLTAAEIFGEEFFVKVVKPHAERCLAGETIRYREWFDLPAYEPRYLEITYSPYVGEGAEVEGFTVNARNITDQKRAEDELRALNKELDQRVVKRTAELNASESRVRFIMSAGPGVLYTCNAHGNYAATFISENVSEHMGYEASQFLEDPGFWASKIHPDDAPRVFADLPQVFETGNHEHEYRFLHADGSYVWMHDSLRLVKDERGEPLELLGLWMDVTDQRRAQEKIEAVNLELTASNKELEAFAYSVSHDLRAPLRGIDGFAQALLDDYRDTLDETGKDYLNRVRAGTQRMGWVIDDLLKLSRLTRAEMSYQQVDLSELAREIADELHQSRPDRRVVFEIAARIAARGDRTLLTAAFENLLRNAWKFTNLREQARIEFGVTQQDGESVYYVRDDGAGFDMAYVDKMFGAFQRLHNTTEFPGTGIGLAIVHRVILRHGGRIWAEGAVDRGATFYFTLPTASSELRQPEAGT